MNMYNIGHGENSDKSYSTTWGRNGAVSVDYRQKLRALQEFRRSMEREKSEFSAEFQRLSSQSGDGLGVIEADSLGAVLAGCEAMRGDGRVRLVWLLPMGGGRIAACLSGDLSEGVAEQGRQAVAARDGGGSVFVSAGAAWELRHAVLNLGRLGAHGRYLKAAHGDFIGESAAVCGKSGQECGQIKKSPDIKLSDIKSADRESPDMELLEMTDEELRRLIVILAPDRVPAELGSMHKEELVDLCSRLRR